MSIWSKSRDSLIKVVKLDALDGYRLRLTFSDGAVGEADLTALATKDAPMTRPLRDPEYFARVFLDFGAPTWPNGFDLAPWALHDDLAKAGRLTHPAARPAE